MAVNLERLKALAKPRDERAHQEFLDSWGNRAWLTYSQDIALALHYYMRVQELTQRELAEQLGVSSVYVGKLLKGGENLTLETICKIEQVLGDKLICVNKPYETPSIIRLAKPYVAPEDVDVSQIYRTVTRPRNRFQRASVRACAY